MGARRTPLEERLGPAVAALAADVEAATTPARDLRSLDRIPPAAPRASTAGPRTPRGRIGVPLATAAAVVVVAGATALVNLQDDDGTASVAGQDESVATTSSPRPGSPALFTLDEMAAAQDLLVEASLDGRVPALVSATGRSDRSGLVVTVTASVLDKLGEDDLTVIYEDLSDMPVTVEVGESPVPLDGSR